MYHIHKPFPYSQTFNFFSKFLLNNLKNIVVDKNKIPMDVFKKAFIGFEYSYSWQNQLPEKYQHLVPNFTFMIKEHHDSINSIINKTGLSVARVLQV